MTENEFILNDRLEKIKSTINKYGEENFVVLYSGGKDSTVVSALVDMALPNNRIPRVFVDTGIELNMIRDFVEAKSKIDNRIKIIAPTTKIKEMLEENGYPFKSKFHSKIVNLYQKMGLNSSSVAYYINQYNTEQAAKCPQKLKYQFNENFKIKISDKCCDKLKKEAVKKWQIENNRKISILGIMREEKGNRINAKCMVFNYNGDLRKFNPLSVITKQWEDWVIAEKNIKICDIYKPPYNSIRTGCKGCPFSINLQKELDFLKKYSPNEYIQCEILWKPIYHEYRRINYRLRQLSKEEYNLLKEKGVL